MPYLARWSWSCFLPRSFLNWKSRVRNSSLKKGDKRERKIRSTVCKNFYFSRTYIFVIIEFCISIHCIFIELDVIKFFSSKEIKEFRHILYLRDLCQKENYFLAKMKHVNEHSQLTNILYFSCSCESYPSHPVFSRVSTTSRSSRARSSPRVSQVVAVSYIELVAALRRKHQIKGGGGGGGVGGEKIRNMYARRSFNNPRFLFPRYKLSVTALRADNYRTIRVR